MARALGLTVTAWSPLARGLLVGKRPPSRLPASRRQDLDAVTEIAVETGLTPARVALAWVLRQGLLPVLGTRTLAQVHDNLGALAVRLDGKQLERLDAAGPPRVPVRLPVRPPHRARATGTGTGGSRSLNTVAGYGTPSSNRAYPAYEPEASAAIPRTVHSTGVLSRRMATAHGMNRGKAGRR